tara:strand:+ start:1325 stop:1702 length:378 start_codon:yes stop_codon:yes gene_type:complete
MKKSQLPISPHLQIYRPQLTSVLSIAHRIAGFFLISLLPLITIWLSCIVFGEHTYGIFIKFMSLKISKLVLILICFGFSYHMLNGIRHIFWDFGYGIEIKTSGIWGVFIILLSCLITIFFSLLIL